MLSVWWVWIVAGFVLGVVEVLVPGYVFLGFAVGAVGTGVLVGTGLLGTAVAPLIFAFAVLSLVGWLGLRRVFGAHKGQVKIWDRDVND